VYALVNKIIESDSEMKIKVTLIQALIRKERWEFLLQKATELGVYRIVPIELKRNVVKWEKNESKNKMDRYQKIMQEAAEQSKRTFVPKLETIIKLNEIDQYKSDINLVAYENEKDKPMRDYVKSNQSVTIICGPEGGFDEREVEYLLNNGFISVSLGKRILRAETAGLYILSGIDFMFEGNSND
jgi:16S rRNA (uracil1498-N3)-methyltransferase